MTVARQKKRIQSIDIMRAIAVLIVVYSHILPAGLYPNGSWANWFLEFLRNEVFQRGQLGVILFFIVSGYVVPFSLLAPKEDNLSRFMVSRFMRLFPAYWVSIAIAVFVVGGKTDAATVILNTTMLQRFFGTTDIIGVYWTLSIELIFYALAAVFFMVGLIQNPRRLGWLTAGLVVTTLLFAIARRWFNAPLPAGSMLFLCLMFGGAWLRLGIYRQKDLWWIVGAFLIVILAITWLLYYPSRYGEFWLLQFSRYLYAILLFFALLSLKEFKSEILAYLGRISYSIYLFHVPVNMLVVRAAQDLPPGYIVLISLTVTIVASSLSHALIERPSIQLGRGLYRFLRPIPASRS